MGISSIGGNKEIKVRKSGQIEGEGSEEREALLGDKGKSKKPGKRD